MHRASCAAFLAAIFFAVPASAGPDVYPIPSAGEFALTARTAPATAEGVVTHSLAVVDEAGTQILCWTLESPAADATTRIVGLRTEAPRATFRAVAYPAPDCQGPGSTPSIEAAHVFLVGPGAPVLLP